MNIVKTCVLRPFSYTFGFDFGLFYGKRLRVYTLHNKKAVTAD